MGPGESIVYLVGPEANKLVLHTHRDCFSHDLGWTPIIGDFLGKGLLNTDDPVHAVHRRMMNPAFTMAYMSRYLPVMQRVIAERTRDWPQRGVVDVYQEARKITFDVAAETLVGFHTGPEVDKLREMFYTVLAGDFDFAVETEDQFWQRVMTTGNELSQRLLAMIAERRASASTEHDDILTWLVRARDDEGAALTDEQILGHVNILLVAGHETSTSLSAWLLYELARHPDYLTRVCDELSQVFGASDDVVTLEHIRALPVLNNAMTETGRLHPPAGNVMYSVAASHRLPTVFAQPDLWDPDRFARPREEDKATPYGLVTFGGGPRICIGINFAQVEIKALAAHVLRAFTLEPVAAHDVEMLYYGATGTLPYGIKMRVSPRAD